MCVFEKKINDNLNFSDYSVNNADRSGASTPSIVNPQKQGPPKHPPMYITVSSNASKNTTKNWLFAKICSHWKTLLWWTDRLRVSNALCNVIPTHKFFGWKMGRSSKATPEWTSSLEMECVDWRFRFVTKVRSFWIFFRKFQQNIFFYRWRWNLRMCRSKSAGHRFNQSRLDGPRRQTRL